MQISSSVLFVAHFPNLIPSLRFYNRYCQTLLSTVHFRSYEWDYHYKTSHTEVHLLQFLSLFEALQF